MPYIVIENFNGGMDTRRMAAAGTPGTLLELTNAHITRGGEIEKRKAFVDRYTLPLNTVGLAADKDGLVVFGEDPDPGMPSGVRYQRLQNPNGDNLARVLSWDLYAGKLYVAGLFSDGKVYHFYDGTRITSWFDGKARGAFTIKETGVEAGALSSVNFFLDKDSEDLRSRIWTHNPDDPENPIDLTGGWVLTDAADGSQDWANQLEAAVDAETGTTDVRATSVTVGGFAVLLDMTDRTVNWNGQRMWLEVEELNVFKVNPNSGATSTLSCTSSTSCQNVFQLDSGVSGGATPYSWQWEILGTADGATATLDDDTAENPEMTVVAPTPDTGCAQYPVTVKVTVTDNTSATVSATKVFVSQHCSPTATPIPPGDDGGGGIVYQEQ